MSTNPRQPKSQRRAKQPSEKAKPPKANTPDQAKASASSAALTLLVQQLEPAPQEPPKSRQRRSSPRRREEPTKAEQKESPKNSHKPGPILDADLQWFDIRRYDTARLLKLSLADWEGLISLRLMYQNDMGARQLSDAEVKYLSDIRRPDPGVWLGVKLQYVVSGVHPD